MTAVIYERELSKYARTFGFHGERVAGSGRGRKSVCDVVLLKDGHAYLVEVKSTRDNTFYVSNNPKTKPRLQKLIKVSEKCGATPILAVRFKHRGKRKTWVIKELREKLTKVNSEEKTLF